MKFSNIPVYLVGYHINLLSTVFLEGKKKPVTLPASHPPGIQWPSQDLGDGCSCSGRQEGVRGNPVFTGKEAHPVGKTENSPKH